MRTQMPLRVWLGSEKPGKPEAEGKAKQGKKAAKESQPEQPGQGGPPYRTAKIPVALKARPEAVSSNRNSYFD
jgi:hypothetical protein